MAALEGEYLGMRVHVDEIDAEHHAFFSHCGHHELRAQRCTSCSLLRLPPTTACPFCAQPEATWEPLSGLGTVYSYGEVHHAIQPVFREHAPYLLLLVELDEQRGTPGEFDGLRLQANLATADGDLAPAGLVREVGIGTRVRVVFKDIGPGIALPLWTVDEQAEQPSEPWRYPIE